jgi:hypothetical protein
MLVDRRVHADPEAGTIAIALRVKCAVSGDFLWLWAPEGLETEQDPPLSAYLHESVHPDAEYRVLDRILALSQSGLLKDPEVILILDECTSAIEFVERYWQIKGRPIPKRYFE